MGSKRNKRPFANAHKRKQLKGIALIKHRAKESSKAKESDQLHRTSSDASAVGGTPPRTTDFPISASESKIGTPASSKTGIDSVASNNTKEGFMIIDVELLCTYLDSVSTCKICYSNLETRPSYSKCQGFAMSLTGYCTACDEETILFHSSKMTEKAGVFSDAKTKRPWEINVRMVSFARAIGKGNSCLDTFTKCLNMPDALQPNAYQAILKYHHDATAIIAEESMKAAASEVKSKYGTDVGVSVDGSWQRRGHASHNGVVTAISTDTGKCLDIEVLSNTCKDCTLWKSKDGTPEYFKWKADHEGNCSLNHTGSAASMEPQGKL